MRRKKTFEQIETEILMEYLAGDEDVEQLRKKRLRRMGQIDENDEPTDKDFNI